MRHARAGGKKAAVWVAALMFLNVGLPSAPAAMAVTARFTRLVKNVALVRPGAPARAAQATDTIGPGALVQTAADSRAELTFADRTVARLGGKTAVRLGAENLELAEGAILFDGPGGTSTATIRTGTIVIEGGGATGIIERSGRTYAKIMLLQGTARVYLPAKVGESMLLEAGQILIMKPEATSLAEPVDFSIAQLYKTSLLIHHEFPSLTSESAIVAAIARQKADPSLIPTNLIIYGRGTLVNLADPAAAKKAAAQNPRSSPSPTPRPSAKPNR
ncbi:MAG: FecR domain-containing protein [Verrucomicrobiota bacterium]|nr:FecR domain-containing protein [Verrucomicrobiota bacterium]